MATSCTDERLFSTVSQRKTGVRALVMTYRLNSLFLLSFERELTVEVLVEVTTGLYPDVAVSAVCCCVWFMWLL